MLKGMPLIVPTRTGASTGGVVVVIEIAGDVPPVRLDVEVMVATF